MGMKRPYFTLLLMSLLILSAFALRLAHLGGHSLWFDELLELDIAQGPFSQIEPQLVRHAAMPLDYYLLYPWVRLGRQESWVRFPALVFGTLAIPLAYLLGRHLFGTRVGYLAAALLAYDSFAVEYSQEARPYALLLCLTLAACLGLWRAYQTHRTRYWLLALAGLSGAALSHYFTLFMLLPIGLFVAVQQVYHFKQTKYWQHLVWFVLGLLILVFIFGVYGRLGVLRSVGGRFSTVISQPESLNLPAAEKPNRGSGPPITIDFFLEKIIMPLAANTPAALLWYNLLFLIPVLSLLGRWSRQHSAILFLLGWLILPIFLIYLFLLQRGTFFAIRYILYTLPAYLLLVAYGIDRLARLGLNLAPPRLQRLERRWKGLAGSFLMILALIPLCSAQFEQIFAYYASDAYEDWRAVGRLLQQQARADDAVIAVRAESAINWYYPPAAAGFGSFWRSEPIWMAINKHPRRWFILSSYSFRQDQALRDWLANQQAVRIAIDRRVEVYFHQEGQSFAEMLAQVKTFALPQHALTYAVLADQCQQHGDLETSRLFYQKAIELAKTPVQKASYEAALAKLPSLQQRSSQ
jgi:4-amino-4-deoxy-L-arabinose transferase-like glycosyltransferase